MTAPAVAAGALVVDHLLARGVTDLVLAPGSRSAPLALAVAAAEQSRRVRLHVRVDERSAGFLAVGLAKVSGRPVALVCTSGTAVANLLPAVVEARYSGVPLVVVTADRPPELRGQGASQTIDQVGIFDAFALGSRDLPVPGADGWQDRYDDWVPGAVALAARARGPVHLNAPFRPPLVAPFPEALEGNDPPVEPYPPVEPVETQAPPVDRYPPVEPVETQASSVEGRGFDTLNRRRGADRVDLPARTVVIAGDLDVWDADTRFTLADLASARGWPVVWEATSGLAGAPTAVPHGTLLLADEAARDRLRADAVLTVGPFGLTRGVLAFVRSAGRHVAVRLRPRTDPPDPLRAAERVVDGVPDARAGDREDGWLAQWRDEARALAGRIQQTRAAGPTVADVAGCVWQCAAPEDLLFVASSLAIRQVAAVAIGPGPHVVANRGANGIDGLVSAAWGGAAAWPARTFALLGDLAFLHDTNGLLVPDGEPRPDLTVVVADNNGGGIFRTLEQGAAEFAADFDRVFGTPHDRDLAAIARAHGVPARVVPLGELAEALREPHAGTRVLVVPVAGADVEATWLRSLVL